MVRPSAGLSCSLFKTFKKLFNKITGTHPIPSVFCCVKSPAQAVPPCFAFSRVEMISIVDSNVLSGHITSVS